MIKSVVAVLLASIVICGTVQAQHQGFGLGLIIGEPTGLSGKQWVDSRRAVDGAVAWSFDEEAALHLHGDFLWHNFGAIKVDRGEFNLYYGLGGRIKFADDSKAGVRVPFGMGYLFETAPMDFFLEIVPILDLAPKTDFSLNAALGIRYFFGQKGHE